MFALDAPVDRAVLADLDPLAVVLAQQKPEWEPGTQQAYAMISLGFYESELLRRVDPLHRSLGRFFEEELASPLGLDFYIGLPAEIPNARLAVVEHQVGARVQHEIALAAGGHESHRSMKMRSTWSEADIPDLSGITAVVTGASNGLGLEIARGLAAKACHLVLAVRSAERGNAAASAIRATSPRASLEVMMLDLADLASVRRFAQALGSRFQRLDLLINNAAAGSEAPQRTADGFESAFGINHLGHFALTGLLLPTMAVGLEFIDFLRSPDSHAASRRFGWP